MRTPLDMIGSFGKTPAYWQATTVPTALETLDVVREKAKRLVGTNGDDRLNGTAGNDVIRAEDGADRVNGEADFDRIYGGNGRDTLMGGLGDDLMHGNGGRDRLEGDRGDDVLLGGYGVDRLDGGQGDDRLHGGNGKDRLEGGKGDDVLAGEGEADILLGGKGDDVLIGGSGTDTMSGGDGADCFAWFKGDADALMLADILDITASLEGEATASGVPSEANWIPWQVGQGGSVVVEDGIVRLEGVDGADEGGVADGDYSAGIGLFWDPLRGPSSALGDEASTLGSLKALGYDWLREEASVNGEAEAPALRLHVDADGDIATTDEVILVYEPWWNGNGFAIEGAWQDVDLKGVNLQNAVFWAKEGEAIDPARDRTLAQWLNGEASEGFTALSKDSLVMGVDLAIGDGWFGNFSGAVDNAFLRFGRADTAWDFEAPAPDVITDFRSGEDKLDLMDLFDDAEATNPLDLLRVEETEDGSTLIAIAARSDEAYHPLVLLEGSGFNVDTDLIVPNPVSVSPEVG